MSLDNKVENIVKEKPNLFRKGFNWLRRKTLPLILTGGLILSPCPILVSCNTHKNNKEQYQYQFVGGSWISSDPNANDSTPGIQDLTPPPSERGYLTSAVVDDKIYVIGGLDMTTLTDVTDTVDIYNPSTDTWTTGTSMPTARAYLTSSVVDGKIYVLGGGDIHNNIKNTIEMYDPLIDMWVSSDPNANDSTPSVQDLTPMPTARDELTAATVNGKIYVMGGWTDTIDIYNHFTDAWTTGTPIPTPRFNLTSDVINNKIHVVGGKKVFINPPNSGWTNILEIYDPSTNTWENGTSMPTPRGWLTSSKLDEKIYVIGGWKDWSNSNDIELYDHFTNTWAIGTPMPNANSGLTSATVNGKIYVIGKGIIEEYTP